jgi:hypothetical protein
LSLLPLPLLPLSLLQLPLSARQPSAQLTGVSVIQAQLSQLELADNSDDWDGCAHAAEAISPTRWYTTSRRATLDHWVLRWPPPDGSRLSTVTVFSQAGEKTVAITDDYGGPSASSTCCR